MKTNLIWLFAFLLILSASVFADGMIVPPHPDDPYPLILNHYVNVSIDGTRAVVHVDQEFQNDGYRDIQGTYLFPVPEGGVKDFKMVVNGEVIEGQMLGADDARRIYQQYAMARKEASLLEYVGRDMFTASVSLPRGEKVRILITYEQIIPEASGVRQYFYPLSPERYTTKPIDPVNITVDINAEGKIGFITSPTHKVEVKRFSENNKHVIVSYYSKEIPDKDFQLYYGVTDRDYDVKLLVQKAAGEDGYFLLFLYPTKQLDQPVPKDVVFVIDTSGSMDGEKISQAKEALLYALDRLNPEDRFNIVTFSSQAEVFASGLQGTDRRAAASSYMSALEASGSTNIYDALNKASDQFQASGDSSRPQIIVLLTDGQDTTGHNAEQILSTLTGDRAKVFPFGVGEDVDFDLLNQLAVEYGDGIPTYVQSDADLEASLTTFVDKISQPLLMDVKLEINSRGNCSTANCTGGPSSYDTYPKRVPDLFFGTQAVIAGRYTGSGMATVKLTGKVAGVEQTFTYNVDFPAEQYDYFVERTWAVKKVGYLLDQIRLEGETEELKEQVKSLAQKYGIPSPYTSYVVTSGNLTYERDVPLQAAQSASGWSAPGAAGSAAQASYKDSESGVDYAAAETKSIDAKTFVKVGEVWRDTACAKDTPDVIIQFGSQQYLDLTQDPQTARYLSVGTDVLLHLNSQEYFITSTGATSPGTGINGSNGNGGNNGSNGNGGNGGNGQDTIPLLTLALLGLAALLAVGVAAFFYFKKK